MIRRGGIGSAFNLAMFLVFLICPHSVARGELNRAKVKALTVGKTTEAGVLRTFGKPAQINENGDGSRTLTFQGGRIVPNPVLTVVVARDKTVKDYTYQEMSLSPFSRKADPALLEALKEGESKIGDVERLLGKPFSRIENADGTCMVSYMLRGKNKGDLPSASVLLFDRHGVLASQNTPRVETNRSRKVDETRWALVIEDKTSEEDVLQLLGKPNATIAAIDGSRTYMYHNPNWSSQEQVFYSVQIGSNGVVSSASRNSSRIDSKTGRSEFGKKIEPEKWWSIAAGVTTEADVIEMFGPPTSVGRMPDESKVYVYFYHFTEVRRLKMTHGGESRRVAFDARGVVRSVDDFSDPNTLEPRPWESKLSADWESLRKEKATMAGVRSRMGEPACAFPARDGWELQMYLYAVEGGEMAAYFASTAQPETPAAIHKVTVPIRDLNALGRKLLRSGGQLTRSGQSTEKQIDLALGNPHLRIPGGGAGTWWIYLTGDNVFLPPAAAQSMGPGGFPQFGVKQTTGVVLMQLNAEGVLRSVSLGCPVRDASQ